MFLARHLDRHRINKLIVDGRLQLEISLPKWSATFRGQPILTDCRLSLEVVGEGDLLAGARLQKTQNRTHDERVRVLFGKADVAHDRYRELRLLLETPRKRRFEVVFRCYDDAIALRYEVPKQAGNESPWTISEEGTAFALRDTH